ncbi:MAG TPA: hypothetical protein VMZ26_01120 [Pyrinomonadaceae bacterium]|nr:hypothetical protein [Pyrinomonadaceae bacterium]
MLLPSTLHDHHIRQLLDRSADLAARGDACNKETAMHSKRMNLLHADSDVLINYCEKLRRIEFEEIG